MSVDAWKGNNCTKEDGEMENDQKNTKKNELGKKCDEGWGKRKQKEEKGLFRSFLDVCKGEHKNHLFLIEVRGSR